MCAAWGVQGVRTPQLGGAHLSVWGCAPLSLVVRTFQFGGARGCATPQLGGARGCAPPSLGGARGAAPPILGGARGCAPLSLGVQRGARGAHHPALGASKCAPPTWTCTSKQVQLGGCSLVYNDEFSSTLMEQRTLDAIGVLIISTTAGGGVLGRLRCNVDSEGGKYTSASPRCTCLPPCQHCAEVALGEKQAHLGYASVYLLSSLCNFNPSSMSKDTEAIETWTQGT